MKKDKTIVNLLLKGGAEPNLLDKDNFSPLGIALREESFKIAGILLNHPLCDVSKGAGMFCSIL